MWIVWWIISSGTSIQSRHVLSAWNCFDARSITKFQTESLCQEATIEEEASQEYSLYQIQGTSKLIGYTCDVRKTTLPAMCGAWSHVKLADVPSILHQVPVSTNWCREMLSRRKFKVDKSSTSFPIQLNREMYISLDEAGSLRRVDNTINCSGQTVKFRKQLLLNTILLTEYHVLVREVQLLAREQAVENTDDHIALACPVTAGGCETGQGTHIWEVPPEECRVQFIRTLALQRVQGTLLVDQRHQIILNETGTVQPPGCVDKFISTEYPKLFLRKGAAPEFHTLQAQDLDMEIENKNRAQFSLFLNWHTEMKIRKQLKLAVCKHTHSSDEEPVRVRDDVFLLSRGSVTYKFVCPQQKMEILVSPKCFADVPVAGTNKHQALFVNPQTRLVRKHSTPMPCSTHFPIIIQEGKLWLELPSLRPVTPPTNWSLLHEINGDTPTLVDLSQGGLYTSSEIQAWEALLAFPNYHESLLKSVTLGTCAQERLCPQDASTPRYDLSNILTEVEAMNPVGWLKRAAAQYGSYCSILVLLYVALKLLIDIVLVGITLLREGPVAVAALLVELYWSSGRAFQRIRRRNLRQRQHQKRRSALPTDDTELVDIRAVNTLPNPRSRNRSNPPSEIYEPLNSNSYTQGPTD